MTEKNKGEIEQLPETQPADLGGVLTEKISRRSFGKLLGAQTVLASTVTLSGCLGGGGGGSDDAPAPSSKTLTRAEFVATISDYFNWPHSSEYKDRFANAQPTFVDVAIGATPYAKQVETALEEGVISNTQGYFYPDTLVTREDAADMYVKAFRIPAAVSNPLTGFTDAGTISADKLASVKAMVAGGYMSGTSTTLFSPKGTLTSEEAKTIQEKITAVLVAPVQVMPKPGTTSPRRYVSYMTPTPGATIYITETRDGTEPADPATAPVHSTFVPNSGGHGRTTNLVPKGFSAAYVPWQHGVRVYHYFGEQVAANTPMIYRAKVVAKKDGMQVGRTREFTWNIFRPNPPWPFEATLVHAPTDTTPAVWKVYNMSEQVQANAYYIEGSERGIIFDFLEYTYSEANAGDMYSFVQKIATKPYVGVLGHDHVDHVAQIASFTDRNIPMYASPQDIATLKARTAGPGMGGNVPENVADAFKRAGNAAIELEDGHIFDLGNCKVRAWRQPGHGNSVVTLIVDTTGWVYASDMWACNRTYTADTTGYSQVKADLMLSLVRQLWWNYQKHSQIGVTEVTNAHQDFPVGLRAALNFIRTYQNVIDYGPAATRPSIRPAGNRMAWIHNYGTGALPAEAEAGDLLNFWGMWHDKNWIANEIGGKYKETELDCLTQPTEVAKYPTHSVIDYNGADGYKKYSVLANLEIKGGELVGKDVYWSGSVSGVEHKLSNKFDPWSYDYQIYVPSGTSSITVTPWAMSSKFKSMTLNGTAVKQGASTTVTGTTAGSKITVVIVSPDGTQTSTYTFTVTNTQP